jgi:hypothetical protein
LRSSDGRFIPPLPRRRPEKTVAVQNRRRRCDLSLEPSSLDEEEEEEEMPPLG